MTSTRLNKVYLAVATIRDFLADEDLESVDDETLIDLLDMLRARILDAVQDCKAATK